MLKLDNWKEILNNSKKIKQYKYLSEKWCTIVTFEYPDNWTIIRTSENCISNNKTRSIVKYNENLMLLSETVYLFKNEKWGMKSESKYSYNKSKNVELCTRKWVDKNGKILIDKSEIQELRTKTSYKEIMTIIGPNNQSITEIKFDNEGREIEFLMYDVQAGERLNTLRTTNQYKKNKKIYSVFSADDKNPNEWNIMTKRVDESFPDKVIYITKYYENMILSGQEKETHFFNNSGQITKIQITELIDNNWQYISKIEYEYFKKYVKSELNYIYKDDSWVLNEKSEYENVEGFLTKKICYEKDNNKWDKILEISYEYI